jgi:hypothetical protein
MKHHANKTYGGLEVQLHEFLPSAQDGGDYPSELILTLRRENSLALLGIEPSIAQPVACSL